MRDVGHKIQGKDRVALIRLYQPIFDKGRNMSQVTGSGVTKARSAVTIGAFTAVYFVLMWCSGMLGFFGPAFMFVGLIVGLLLNGPVVMLMLVRSRMFGTLTIMGGVVAFLMVVTGHSWVTVPVALILGFLGDLIARGGGYVSAPRNIAAYMLFSLWMIGPLAPIFFAPDSYYADVASSMGQDYADAMRALFSPAVIGGWLVVAMIIACIGGLIGRFLLRKHFAKAGVA